MKKQQEPKSLAPISHFKMPSYREIPSVGLYLKQVVRLINETLEPYFGIRVTETMLSNYVKMHLIPSPVKKQYDREQIATLLFITLAKSVVSLENIQLLLNLQRTTTPSETAYEYFTQEFQSTLNAVYKGKDIEPQVSDASDGKVILRNLIITLAHRFYLESRFLEMKLN